MHPGPEGASRWRRYVAIGDSFTEGLLDEDPARPGGYRGWADRLAEHLDGAARRAGAPPLEYANLAVRGRLLGAVLEQQLPAALAARPDLVSLSGGGNDLLRPRADVDALAAAVEDAVQRLRAAGADVLLITGVDPRDAPVVRLTRGRVAAYNLHLWAIARRHGAAVLDLWGMRALYDWRMWAPDRIHLSAEGHRRVGLLAAATLLGATGAAEAEWARPLAPEPGRPRWRRSVDDARWAREHLVPWVRRRATGRSSGDAVTAKRPRPAPLGPSGG
ncbi:SGNH/GDSL hydrolase family protein [Quadrisphaera sp. DSM 44207]|uniref:SGNH/GDSL hydrolase family protein n=1 Tax=Quadrisphaera sp. DSM 44207 TaxID=1881057 RepID=UPI000887EA00|nr:SGNH/GDSL hydrolase family protein [Quadrisphaera sp. DSM 44207]SDQ64349.1 Lysophospholipase L1 [Quadrisphaera sp. DSM 44207]